MSRRTILFATVGAMVLAAAPVAAAGPGTPNENAAGYWTAERVQSAQPRDVVLDAGRGDVIPRPKPEKPDNPNKKPAPDDGGGTDDPPADETVVTGASWPDTDPGDPFDDITGKVLFTLGSGNYVCSASSIAPSPGGNGWIVMTAGHCTWDDGIGMAENWVFVPDFDTVLQFGCTDGVATCHEAAKLYPTAEWMGPGDDYLDDVAFARMAGPRPQQDDVGSLPVLRVETATGAAVTAFGYPAAKKYSGDDLVYCRGTATAGPGQYGDNPALACDMTGGSSGGPWYTNVDGDVFATSLNSFGLRGYNGYMFGPLFGPATNSALEAASAADSTWPN